MKKIYIAGPMMGYPNKNFPAFDRAANRLIAEKNWVTSPADLERNRPPVSYKDMLRDDLKAMLECDTLYVLRGWETSNGALLEIFVAQSLGMEILYDKDYDVS